MALENYRPIQFPEKTELDSTDVVLIDSATNGTNKYQLNRIAAQAAAQIDAAVEAEEAARQAADSALDGKIGTLSNLTTTAKGSAVAAINEVDANADAAQSAADANAGKIGTLSSLTTDAKTDLVSAVNEVDAHADANTSALSGKVDKVAGKGLSKNDFTDALKTKLDGIETGAEVNDVTSVAGKTGDVTLGGGDVSYNEETTYAAGTVGKAVTDLKSDFNKYTPYSDDDTTGTASKTGTTFFISEKKPRNFSPLPLGTIVKGRNRFNIATAAFTFSGNSSSNTLTKENNGIKNVSTQTSTSTSTHCYTEYTAEYTGNLFFSCDASVDGNVRDLRVSANINGVSQEILWGAGPLFMVLPVTAGDTVRLKFFVHAQTPAGSTVYYKNIMLSYDGLYPFESYQADMGISVVPTMKEISLASKISDGTNHSSGSLGDKCVTISGLLSDLYSLPSSNDVAAQDVTALPSTLGIVTDAYNAVYNAGVSTSTISRGIGINTSGNLVVYIDGKGKSDIATWLESNPVTISYKIGQTSESVEIDPHEIQEGMIVVLPDSGTITYNYEIVSQETVVCFGDSITGIYKNKANYPEIITITSDYSAVNCGFSGMTYTDHPTAGRVPFSLNRLIDAVVSDDFSTQDTSSYVDPENANYSPLYAEHLENLEAVNWSEVEYVTFFYGTNDYINGAYLNSEDDPATENKQRTNIEDCVKYCISQLLTKYPHLRILVLAPYWMTFNDEDANEHTNNKGKYLYEYNAVIEEVAKNGYNLPVINMYHMFGINPITKWYFEKDDAHPTDRLKRIIAENIVSALSLD